ncbi:MAG: type II toxin-antitoxin system VapC family toxin [Cyanobacteria bacterium P01_F01_bin.143]
MSDFVLDCSVSISWIFSDEHSDYAESVLRLLEDQQAIVPSIWLLEIANVLLVGERRGRITQEQTSQALLLLDALDIVIDDKTDQQAFSETLILGRKQGLAAYNAAYLELAIRLKLPLATLDKRLATVANHCGVMILDLNK